MASEYLIFNSFFSKREGEIWRFRIELKDILQNQTKKFTC